MKLYDCNLMQRNKLRFSLRQKLVMFEQFLLAMSMIASFPDA